MTLSVCMIVKNEEDNIERAIKSALPIADEIIVVDTGSNDNTVKIVRDLIGRVYFTPWIDDFAAARNKSIAFATKEWIMWLDADDVIPESTYEHINKIKTTGNKNYFYSGTIKCTDIGNISYVMKPEFEQGRIFPNHKKIYFENKIHETFTLSAIRNGLGLIRTPEMVIEHKGYSDNITLERKRRRNIRITMNSLGFPDNVDYYEFDYEGCFCVYTPNVVVAWKGIEYIGAMDVENMPDMDLSARKAVDKIIIAYDMRKIVNQMNNQAKTILKLDDEDVTI